MRQSRKYEAAERSFFRCLKELRAHERAAKAAEHREFVEELGSFLPGEMTDREFDKLCGEEQFELAREKVISMASSKLGHPGKKVGVPIAIGKAG